MPKDFERDDLPTKKEILDLENKYRKQMVGWKKDDTLYSFFKRNRMNALAAAFLRDYKRLKLPFTK